MTCFASARGKVRSMLGRTGPASTIAVTRATSVASSLAIAMANRYPTNSDRTSAPSWRFIGGAGALWPVHCWPSQYRWVWAISGSGYHPLVMCSWREA